MFNLHIWFPLLIPNEIEWKQPFILLNSGIAKFSPDQSLDVKNCSRGVLTCLILGSISDQSGSIWEESNVGWSDSISLFIGAYFNTSIAPDGNT
jgi:hypothetical protein